MNKPIKPKLNVEKKPLNLQKEKDRDRQQLKAQIHAEQEKIITETMANLILEKRIINGVGEPSEFYDEILNGFKKTLSAKGIPIPDDLNKLIKDNGGRIADKDRGPKIVNLTKKFGVVPSQD